MENKNNKRPGARFVDVTLCSVVAQDGEPIHGSSKRQEVRNANARLSAFKPSV